MFQSVGRYPMCRVLIAGTLLTTGASTQAALNVRHFEFGESDFNASGETAQVGDVVVSTHNRLGEIFLPDDPFQMDLAPPGGTSPVYVEGRSGPGSLAVAFDGKRDAAGVFTALQGPEFCTFCGSSSNPDDVFHALSAASDEQFTSTFAWGFQGWIKPDAAGAGTEQVIVHNREGSFGGVGITSDGNWLNLSFRGGRFREADTGIPVAFNDWTHLAQVFVGNVGMVFINTTAL